MKLRRMTWAILAAFATGVQAAPTLIAAGDVSATIEDSGNFATSFSGGPPGLAYKGREFIDIDTESSWYWLKMGGTDSVAQYGSNPLGAAVIASGGAVVLNGAFGGLTFFQTTTIPASNQLAVQVQLTNNTGKSLTDVWWGVGFDPDQDGSGKNTTKNVILGQGAAASVSATGPLSGYTVVLANTTSAAAFAIASYINPGDCCSAVDPSSPPVWVPELVGFSTLADDSISLNYRIGAIDPGQTVTIGYSYTFSAPIPEPETYAMLMAGLGLMSFVARRRTRG